MASFLTLPVELHLRILELAGWKATARTSQTCRRLHEICSDAKLWREMTRRKFDLKSYDVGIHGQWQKLFAALAHDKLYVWGADVDGIFFQPTRPRDSKPPRRGMPMLSQGRRMTAYHQQDRHEPTLVPPLEDKVMWADIQTGGWGAVMLTVGGDVWLAGKLDNDHRRCPSYELKKLDFGGASNIVQVSMGRTHIVALSDTGDIFMLHLDLRDGDPTRVTFLELETAEDDPTKDPAKDPFRHGAVRKVVAGWGGSAAIVEGYGVVFWSIDGCEIEERTKTAYMRSRIVPFLAPNTAGDPAFSSTSSSLSVNDVLTRASDAPPEAVCDLVVGEHYLVALTTAGRVFAALQDHNAFEATPPVEMRTFRAPAGQPPFARIAGQFRQWAVFSQGGAVFIGTNDIVAAAFENVDTARRNGEPLVEADTRENPQIVKGLQNRGIIDISFGDWHFLALDQHGTVYSWGGESGGRGSLGLGPQSAAKARGVNFSNVGQGRLETPTEVWFGDGGNLTDETGSHRYFAYKIAAGGWHSCALTCKIPTALTLEHATATATATASASSSSSSSKPEPAPEDGGDGAAQGPPVYKWRPRFPQAPTSPAQ